MRTTLLLLFCLPVLLVAATINVPADEASIAAGLAAATAGDTVLVACGHYIVRDLVMKEGVTLRSASGEAGCVTLNGQSNGRIMSGSGLSEATRIEGFTFQWGRATLEGETGGALHLVAAHLTIRHCDFLDSVATWGGAIAALNSRAVFEDCRFLSNRAYYYGGAVWCDDEAPLSFIRCDFTGNESSLGGGALSSYGASNTTLIDCHFRENESAVGAGLHAITASPLLERCSFVDNIATSYGGAFALQGGDASILHCSFVDNEAPLGSALDYRSHEGWLMAIPNLRCCIIAFNRVGIAVSCENGDAFAWDTDIYGHLAGDWTGCMAPLLGNLGNISRDPQFCSHDDFINLGLQSDTPCAGEGCEGAMGAFPVSCGDAAAQKMSWSRLKPRY
jgi:hypothetical protein